MNQSTSTAWREYAADVLPPILQAALGCFMEAGYHGTSIRTVASRAGLSVPGVYHHYRSKQALLVEIDAYAMQDLWERCVAALEEAGDDVGRRFDLLVECQVLFHAHRQALAFIASSEIRALEAEARAHHIAERDRVQRLMDQVIHAGVEQGRLRTPYPREAGLAIITMCTSVAQWYRIGKGLTPQELAERYRSVARMAVGLA